MELRLSRRRRNRLRPLVAIRRRNRLRPSTAITFKLSLPTSPATPFSRRSRTNPPFKSFVLTRFPTPVILPIFLYISSCPQQFCKIVIQMISI
jgi:hypothetical protein